MTEPFELDKVKLYTTKEVAALLRVHTRTVNGWCKEGKLDFVKVNNVYMFTDDMIEKFLKGEDNNGQAASHSKPRL